MQPEVIGGRYRVGAPVGRGGMGTVWLCRDELLHRDVAVKQVGLLPGESVTDSARAFREARSSAALSHRNVITVFDVVEEDGAIWLVMEYLPSRSLAQIIKEDGPLEPARVAAIGAQVADGLAAAHASGTTHRDVKPGNVLVRDDGLAKISDFGIARSAGDPALTGSGLLTGTPGFFSPELTRGAAPAPASDVWALGATLYAAVEGHPPYPLQENPVAVLHDIASHQPPAPRHAGFLEPSLVRMMDRDPQSRWSMVDAAHSLHRLADRHAPDRTRAVTLGAASSADSPAHRSRPAPRQAAPSPQRSSPEGDRDGRGRRRGALAVLIGLGLLVVIGGIAFALARGGGPGSGDGPSSSDKARSSVSHQTSSSSGPATSTPASGGLSAKADFLRRYFSMVPGGSDQAWAELTPAYQHRIGRGSFDGFWRTISSVTVSQVVPASGDSVEATLTYRTTDGRTSTERHRIELVRSGNGYRINGDAPA